LGISPTGHTSQCTLERTDAVHVHGGADHDHSNVVHGEAIAKPGEALKWLGINNIARFMLRSATSMPIQSMNRCNIC
jgi:hypothetical protein